MLEGIRIDDDEGEREDWAVGKGVVLQNRVVFVLL